MSTIGLLNAGFVFRLLPVSIRLASWWLCLLVCEYFAFSILDLIEVSPSISCELEARCANQDFEAITYRIHLGSFTAWIHDMLLAGQQR